MLILKHSVTVRELNAPMLLAVLAAKDAYALEDADTVITSGGDGKHSRGSLHYSGNALDFRTRHLDSLEAVDRVVAAMRLALGAEYDVVKEPTHIHVEYQPKGPVE